MLLLRVDDCEWDFFNVHDACFACETCICAVAYPSFIYLVFNQTGISFPTILITSRNRLVSSSSSMKLCLHAPISDAVNLELKHQASTCYSHVKSKV